MNRLGLLLNLLLALGLALAIAGAPRAMASGPTLVICGADGVFSVPLDGGTSSDAPCCDCCLAGCAGPLAAPATLAGRSAPLLQRVVPTARCSTPRRAARATRARAPPLSA